jgi:tetratricopeptide (TPR) repeat protein
MTDPLKCMPRPAQDPCACIERGDALRGTGDNAHAIAWYRRAIDVSPQPAEAYFKLGCCYHDQQELNRAADSYRRAIAAQPDFVEAYYNAGRVYQDMGRMPEAVQCYRTAIDLKPDLAQAHNNLGQIHLSAGETQQAIDCFQRALQGKSDFAEPHFNLAEAFRLLKHPTEAAAHYKAALRLNPSLFGAWNNLGNLLRDQGDLTAAAECFHQVVRLQPDLPEGHYNLGSALKDTGDLEQAVASLRQSLRLQPHHAESWNNLALAYKTRGQFDKALTYFSQALRLKDDLAEAHWNRSFVYLLQGSFEHGWQDFEWRFRLPKWQLAYPFRQPLPRWNGACDPGLRILVHDEQGLGDTLQFVRYLPLVKARCHTVILETRRELIGLLQHVAGADAVVERPSSDRPFTGADCHAPLLSLPMIFGTRPETIPAGVPYIRPEPRKESLWQERLSCPGTNVGIVWAGRPEHQNDRNRSCRLEQFARLAEIPGVRLIGLQKGPAASQADETALARRVLNLGGELQDFADTAALISHLDLIISVDTAVVHLAGAMGKPVWVLLPFVPDWRWMLNREDSPWYPTMRLFRQHRPGDWPDVFDRLAAALQSMPAVHGTDPRAWNGGAPRIGRDPERTVPSSPTVTPGNVWPTKL